MMRNRVGKNHTVIPAPPIVIPAKAGIHHGFAAWIPAFAGMTGMETLAIGFHGILAPDGLEGRMRP